jgi:hypothetical protein
MSSTDPLSSVDAYVLFIVLARWNLPPILRAWEDQMHAERGYLLG